MSAVLQGEVIDSFSAYDTYQAVVKHDDIGQLITEVYDCDGYPADEPRHLFSYGLPISSERELIELLAVFDAGEKYAEGRR